VTLELAESLLLADAVSPRALARGLFLDVTQRMSLVQALLATGALDEAKIEAAVGRNDVEPLATITPSLALVQRLPHGLCSRLLVVPIGTDAESGAVDLAVVDLRDEHAAKEAAFFLQRPMRLHRATVSAIRSALEQIQRADASLVESAEPAHGERSRTPIWGTPVVSVAPPASHALQGPPHVGGDMPIPLMRRSSNAPALQPGTPGSSRPRPVREEDSAVLELRTPHSSRAGAPASSRPAPDTERDTERKIEEPIFNLRAPLSVRRPASVMIADMITDVTPKSNTAVTIPAPKDPRHTMVTSPAPARRSEPPPPVIVPAAPRSSIPSRRPSSQPRLDVPRLPFPDAAPVLAAMEEANDRDAILALVISGMRAVARRVAIMAVKRDAFVGWTCNAEFGDARAWRSVQVPAGLPSVLATAAAGTSYLGPLFRTDGHMPIIDFMKEASRDVAAVGVRVDMRPALVLLADELGDTALGTKRLDQLAKAAGVALGRLLRKVQT
jgi:hypothetical protein